MAKWLMKSEPETFSWDDLVRDGSTQWDGVRNYAARQHLNAMQAGDEAFFYHSGKGPAVVGIMRVTGPAVPDGDEGGWVKVPVAPVRPLARYPQGDQGRAEAREDGAGPPVAPLRLAGARRGMGFDPEDGGRRLAAHIALEVVHRVGDVAVQRVDPRAIGGGEAGGVPAAGGAAGEESLRIVHPRAIAAHQHRHPRISIPEAAHFLNRAPKGGDRGRS